MVPLIVEALGGIGRRGARCLRFLARRASCRKRGRDGTTYNRFHPSNYLSHHLAGIVTAAVFSDAARTSSRGDRAAQDRHQRRDEDRGGG